jgi:hypothetical protein
LGYSEIIVKSQHKGLCSGILKERPQFSKADEKQEFLPACS